jgi:hypothetical protein
MVCSPSHAWRSDPSFPVASTTCTSSRSPARRSAFDVELRRWLERSAVERLTPGTGVATCPGPACGLPEPERSWHDARAAQAQEALEATSAAPTGPAGSERRRAGSEIQRAGAEYAELHYRAAVQLTLRIDALRRQRNPEQPDYILTPMQSASVAIQVEALHMTFRVPRYRVHALKERALHPYGAHSATSPHVLYGSRSRCSRGEFFGIVSRSQIGQSTVLKWLAGIYKFEPARSGSVGVCRLSSSGEWGSTRTSRRATTCG